MHNPRELAERHTELARHEARRLGRGDDGLAECYLALVEAACEWDPGADVPFEAWARQLIRLRTRRRLSDQRVITVPWRVRAQLAEMLDRYDALGRAPQDPSAEVLDPVLLAALNAITVQNIPEGVDFPSEAGATWSSEPGLPQWAMLRYGYDGFGLKTVTEVASMMSLTPEEVLALDAELLRYGGYR